MTYIVGAEEKPSPEEALAHHGVMGMKWGHRKASDSGSASSQRQKMRQLDKASRAKDNAARNKSIDDARNRYASTSRANYLKAKDQYKKDKVAIGKREAAKKFNAVKQKNMDDFEVASQAKSGHETAVAVLTVVGTVAVASILSALANSSANQRL